MGLPTMIMANFTSEQLEAYTLHLRIEEISQKLRINDVVPGDGDRYVLFVLSISPATDLSPRRSPSPPPQYDNFGRRVNTREYRYRKRLEDERHKLVEKAMKTIPNYNPPSDYRRPTKTQEKVYVPVNDYPEINFSMITNPLTPNHSFIVSVMSFCLIRVDGSYLTGCPQLVSCQTLVLNVAHALKKIWITNT
jgi:splicing factor 1